MLESGVSCSISKIPDGITKFRIYSLDNPTSQSVGRDKGEGAASWFPVQMEGKQFKPSMTVRWKTNETGMERLKKKKAAGLKPRRSDWVM